MIRTRSSPQPTMSEERVSPLLSTDDVKGESNSAPSSTSRTSPGAAAARALSGLFILLFMMMLVMKTTFLAPAPDERRTFSSSCMHATGGGVVGPRGSLLHFDPRCTEELKEYFDQAYFTEVRRVADDAITYFRGLTARQDAAAAGKEGSRGTVVFDIDETALSNMDGFFGASGWARLLGTSAAPTCTYPHLEFQAGTGPRAPTLVAGKGLGLGGGAQHLTLGGGGGGSSGAGRQPVCQAPALRAVQELYYFLHASNYTVVFLTGRAEADRDITAANLLAAGYGSQCGKAAAANTAAAATVAATSGGGGGLRRQLRQSASASGSGSSSSSALSWGSPFGASLSSPASASPARPPCYGALLMRVDGDARLASVFKAEARGGLVAAGHTIVGNIGDQFSDLVGEHSAPASFKLPNPVYTLL